MAKANECFRRAQDLVNMKNFDYAIELYISGLEHWPEAIDEGHKPCRAASLFRGKVKLPFGSSMKWSTSGKDAKKAMLNAETLLSKEPQNIAYMEALFKNAEKAGYVATAMWIGEIYADAAVREAKPVDRLKTLHEVYGRISDRAKDSDPRLAITAMERALDAITKLRNLKPTDGVVANTLRDTAGKLTILKGNYSKAESFRESVHDTEGQKEIYDKDRLIQADERVDELIAVAQTRYEANPTDQRFINDLVDLLCRRENEADEKRAIKVLLDTHKATTDYRYKSRAYDIRIKQNRRAIRALRDGSNEEKLKAAEKEALQFELQVFRDRIKNYPTDMRLRYEYGRRLFEAGNYDEAIPYLQDARADRKVRYHCSLYVGRCFYKKNYYAQAIDTFREALGTYEMPDDDLGKQLNYWLGRSLEADSRTEEALKIYGQLIQWDYNYRKGDVRERIDALRGN
ncbi:MAG: tetratricopeptide repeat protein [Phycisphaerae bacterium]|nr:tetratricopeptide repeat protein [Phycisphaerae bacterium]